MMPASIDPSLLRRFTNSGEGGWAMGTPAGKSLLSAMINPVQAYRESNYNSNILPETMHHYMNEMRFPSPQTPGMPQTQFPSLRAAQIPQSNYLFNSPLSHPQQMGFLNGFNPSQQQQMGLLNGFNPSSMQTNQLGLLNNMNQPGANQSLLDIGLNKFK